MSVSTTIRSLLERVKRDATLGVYGPIYTLKNSIVAGDTALEVNEAAEHITPGSTLAIGTELVRVSSINASTGVVSVVRAQGASAADSYSAGEVIEVDPRLPLASLWDWAEHEIRSWRKVLWKAETLNLDVARNERTYELVPNAPSTEVHFLLDVRMEPVTGSVGGSWDDFGTTWVGDAWAHVEARLLRDQDAAAFPSGYAIQLLRYPRHTGSLRVAYASDFDLSAFTLTDDLVADVGLDMSMIDVLEQGVRWRALQAGMVPRTDWRATGVLREPEQVSLIDVVRAIDMARSLRDRRFNEEALVLRSRWPYRRAS